ncbi:hypothetical protein BH20ACT23_BH20ACT23_24470 [soil metagenome]
MNDRTPDVEEKTNAVAVLALICGALGFLVIPIVGSIAGLVLGLRAKRSIERSEGREGGRELAVAGIVLGSVGLAAWSGLLLFGFGIDALRSIF